MPVNSKQKVAVILAERDRTRAASGLPLTARGLAEQAKDQMNPFKRKRKRKKVWMGGIAEDIFDKKEF